MPEQTQQVTTVYIWAHEHPGNLTCSLQFTPDALVEIPADVHEGYEYRHEPICSETGQYLTLVERRPDYPEQHRLALKRAREAERPAKKESWWQRWGF